MNSGVVIKWCNTCSRTFSCEWPEGAICESWAPDFYASAEIANGAEVVEQNDIPEEIDVEQ